jgi:predicted permease
MAKKRKTFKKVKPKKSATKQISSPDKKKRILGINILRFLIFFVVSLVLYFVVSNEILGILFGVLAILTGAIVIALFLILVGFWIVGKRAK